MFFNLLREKIRENFHHAGELQGATGSRGLSFCRDQTKPLEVHISKRAKENGPDYSEPFPLACFGSTRTTGHMNFASTLTLIAKIFSTTAMEEGASAIRVKIRGPSLLH